jgi:hypothetical protein
MRVYTILLRFLFFLPDKGDSYRSLLSGEPEICHHPCAFYTRDMWPRCCFSCSTCFDSLFRAKILRIEYVLLLYDYNCPAISRRCCRRRQQRDAMLSIDFCLSLLCRFCCDERKWQRVSVCLNRPSTTADRVIPVYVTDYMNEARCSHACLCLSLLLLLLLLTHK